MVDVEEELDMAHAHPIKGVSKIQTNQKAAIVNTVRDITLGVAGPAVLEHVPIATDVVLGIAMHLVLLILSALGPMKRQKLVIVIHVR